MDMPEEEGDLWYTPIKYVAKDVSAEVLLVICNDNNLYMMDKARLAALGWQSTCLYLWGGYDGYIIAPPGGGVMHYYKNTMAAVGVSRLRVSDEDEVPAGAELAYVISISLSTCSFWRLLREFNLLTILMSIVYSRLTTTKRTRTRQNPAFSQWQTPKTTSSCP